jgi:hypothetical protein
MYQQGVDLGHRKQASAIENARIRIRNSTKIQMSRK